MSAVEERPTRPDRSEYRTAVPAAHRNAVTRRRLLAAMFADPQAPRVVVVHAPAGHGKTSVLVQAEAECRKQGLVTAWLTIDSADDDATRLTDLLHQMVSQLTPPRSRGTDATATGSGGRDSLETRFAAVGRPAAVFIDDLHFLNNDAAAQVLLHLLMAPAPCVRWFVGSRKPPKGLSKLVIDGDTLQLRAEELRFSLPETREFFAESGAEPLSDTRINNIIDTTEGWPAALQLYRLALRASQMFGRTWDPPDPRSAQLAEYLGDNVLDFQEPVVREFLTRTAALDRMNAELCDSVLGRTDSAALLAEVEHRGLFLRRLSSAEGWFTYHAIFLTFLRSRLHQRDPEVARDVHRKAAAWYIAHGHDEDAIHHYLAIGEHGLAADVLNRWIDTLVTSGYMATVDKWLDETPKEELLKRPSLLVKIVWALAFLSRNQKIGPVLDLWRQASDNSPGTEGADARIMLCVVDVLADRLIESDRHITGVDTADDGDGRFRTFELGVTCNARGYRDMARGEFDKALREFERGRELNTRAGAMFALACSLGKAALVRLSQGNALEAVQRLTVARATTGQNLEGSLSDACLVSAHIASLYEVGEFDSALTEFDRNRGLIETGAIHDYLVIAFRAVSRIYDLRGQPARSAQILNDAENLAHTRLWPRAARLIGIERARRATLAGQLDWVDGYLGIETPVQPGIVRVSAETEDEAIAATRYLITAGRSEEAMRLLRPLLVVAKRQGRVLRQIKLHVLAARAEHAMGNSRSAHRNLQESLDLAAPGECRYTILDEGPVVVDLLTEHQNILSKFDIPDERAGFLNDLLPAHAAESADRVPGSEVALADFTDRELDVLRLISRHLSNAQIAEALFVSADTVKYHLKNIYAKTGTNNKAAATAIARRIGLD